MILLNVSPYVPNQVLMALTGLGVFVAVRVWAYRRAKRMWNGAYRAVGLAGLWLFLTVSLFVASGLYGPLKPWQPAIHMLEELAVMGVFIYATFHAAKTVPFVVNNSPLRLLLKSSAVTFPVCWLSALAVGYTHPFPMTGILLHLPPEAFAYRALLIVPCLFYAVLMSAVIIRHYRIASAEGGDLPFRRRLRYFSLAQLSILGACVDQLTWSYLQSFADRQTLRNIAPSQVVTENAIFFAIGLFWVLGIVFPAEHSTTDQALHRHKRFLRAIRGIKIDLLTKLPRCTPHRLETLSHIRRASEDPALNLSPRDRARAEKVFELVAAKSTGATEHGPDSLLGIGSLYDALIDNLPLNSPERETWASDPLPTALRPAADALQRDRRKQDEEGPAYEPRWAQLGYAAAADLGLLQKNVLSSLDPEVVIALHRAKAQNDEHITF